MLQQVQPVVLAALRADGILLRDLHVRRRRLDAVLVQVGGKGDLDLRVEERGGETLVDAFGNPPFAQVEVQVVEGDGLGRRLAQRLQRFPGRDVVGMLPQERLDSVGLPDDVAGDELVGHLVAVRFRVVVDTPLQLPEYSLHGSSRERCHVVRFHPAVLVQARHEGLGGIGGVRDLVGIEGHGTVEDVGLACLAVDVTLQREDLRPPRVHLDQVEVALVVELPEAFGKAVVKAVEHLPQRGVRRQRFRLVAVKVEIGIAYLDIHGGFHLLPGRERQRVEHGLQGGQAPQVAHPVFPVRDERSLAEIVGDLPLERAGCRIHLLCRRCLFHGIGRSVEQTARACRAGLLPAFAFRGLCRGMFGACRLPLPLFRGCLLPGTLLPQFRPPLRGERHHHLVETVDRRVVLPVQGGVQGFGVTLRGRRFRGLRQPALLRGGRREERRLARSFPFCSPASVLFPGHAEFGLPPLLGGKAEQIVKRQQRLLLHVYRLGGLGGGRGSRCFHRVEKRPGEPVLRFCLHRFGHGLHGSIRQSEILGPRRVLLPQAVLPLFRPGPEVGQILLGRLPRGCGGRFRQRLFGILPDVGKLPGFSIEAVALRRHFGDGVAYLLLFALLSKAAGVGQYLLDDLPGKARFVPLGPLPFRPARLFLTVRFEPLFGCMFQVIALVEMSAEVLREHTPQLPVDAVHALRVGKLHRRFAVGVFAHFGLGVDHPVERLEKVVYRNPVRQLAGFDEVPLPLGEFPRGGSLLQDNQVAADFRSRVVCEEVVGQPHGRYGAAAVHQPLAYGAPLLGVQHPLRGDEGHQAALVHHIDGLHEKIVVQRPRALPPHGIGMGGEERVEERHVPERDVAHGHVVVTGVFGFDALEALHPHPFVGVQVFQDQPRGGVFLEAGDLRVGVVEIDGPDEDARPGTGVEDAPGSGPGVPYRLHDGVGHLRGRVKCRQDGVLDPVHVALVFPLVGGVRPDDLVQLGHESRHALLVRLPGRGFQHLFYGAETAVRVEYPFLFRGRRTPFPFEREGRLQRVDVPAEVGFLIEGHLRGVFGRFPSVRCIAIRSRACRRSRPGGRTCPAPRGREAAGAGPPAGRPLRVSPSRTPSRGCVPACCRVRNAVPGRVPRGPLLRPRYG